MIVIYHNPACETSRNVLAFVRAVTEPVVIPYLEAGWTQAHLIGLFAAANVTPRQALRTAGTPAVALGLVDPDVPDAAILDAMVAHPILVNRPFVCSPLGTRLCRPSETVLALLPTPSGHLHKEDGTPRHPATVSPSALSVSASVAYKHGRTGRGASLCHLQSGR